MKRILSLILAALLLTSSVVSCGKSNTDISETKASETNIPETNAVETNTTETETPETNTPAASYDSTLITENGVAKSHIVLFDGASDKEKTAADELAYHIKLVSGADVAITNEVQPDSLPIIIATPDTLPELEELFPEDLAWLRTTKETTEDGIRNYASDGFAVRAYEGKIYIFGATPLGARNGAYDFIEENLDLIWVGSTESDIIYEEMPTITTAKVNYREKSPFEIRSRGGNAIMTRRNKYDTATVFSQSEHNVKSLVISSPIYDPNITEYWDTDVFGNHLTYETSGQVNFWSQLTADTIAAAVIQDLDSYSDDTRPTYYSVGLEDIKDPFVIPAMKQSFEYAPGQFVDTSEGAYFSTVYYTFINRIAQKVAEKYPEVSIVTIAYTYTVQPPLCELEDNVAIWFCPFTEDVTQDSFEPALADAEAGIRLDYAKEAMYYFEWIERFPDTEFLIYNYYFTSFVNGWYERAIWDRLQYDLQLYAEHGVIGTTACTVIADDLHVYYYWQTATHWLYPRDHAYKYTHDEAHAMTLLTNWLYYKLCWNPFEDLDALILEFCDKVYGDASEYMQEYYKLLEISWDNGGELISETFNGRINCDSDEQYYFDYFLDFYLDDGTYFLDAIKDILTKAWETADDRAKEFIRRPYEVFSEDWTRFIH